MKKVAKTNAMRILDQQKVPYDIFSYDTVDKKIDGVSVAEKIGKPPEEVYKTLVCQSPDKELYVFLLPVHLELDLKKAAQLVGEKKLELLPVSELQKWTGYVRGGCSPIGMKKNYPTWIDKHAEHLSHIIVSAGKIGLQLSLSVSDLLQITKAQLGDIVKD
ncbi:Cys-tRNA(Pro) deacylase [Aeribacillus pallidus]|jgi:Cys-tRNA(Pro)/Cys-tRNA(Cys) deacylase|uniref:Cys-tRNA(Pro) deacylase n=1 Tax=Aeribacillus pallidus TaxID=33936 RepID=UPI003D2435B6